MRNGDVVVELDGVRKDLAIRQLHAHLQLHRDYGDTIRLTVLRGGTRQELTLTLPTAPPPFE